MERRLASEHASSGAAAGLDWPAVRERRRAWRLEALALRPAPNNPARAAAEAAGLERLHGRLQAHGPAMLGIYWPFRREIDIRPLARRLDAEGWRLALPVPEAGTWQMVFGAWRPGEPVRPGVWRIPVPSTVVPVTPEVVVAPLVGFDRACYRLGNGGGYYDRYLAGAGAGAIPIGFGFASGEIESILPQPHDVPMHAIVTERETIERAEGKARS